MRGPDIQQAAMFSYLSLERRIPPDHPLRAIRRLTDRALERIDGELDKLYPWTGRESTPPERLLRALLLMVLYSVRSERQLMEQLNYNLLFRWFVGLEMDDEVWDATVFTKNRDRLIEGKVSQELLTAVVAEAREKELLSAEHFTLDGTLIQAWAAARSFQEKSDPPAAEREAALEMVDQVLKPKDQRAPAAEITLGADTQYQIDWFYRLVVTAYNLMRMGKLIPLQVG